VAWGTPSLRGAIQLARTDPPPAPHHRAADLAILPGPVTLDGPESYQQLLAEASLDNHQEDWTRTAHWTSSNPAVATVDQTGLIRPVSDGETTITATPKPAPPQSPFA
jgi:hypothetical protein